MDTWKAIRLVAWIAAMLAILVAGLAGRTQPQKQYDLNVQVPEVPHGYLTVTGYSPFLFMPPPVYRRGIDPVGEILWKYEICRRHPGCRFERLEEVR